MNSKKVVLGILLMLFAVHLSGCIEKDAVTTDTYRCTVDGGVLYLFSDNSYEILIDEMYGGGGIYGNFTVRDGTVRLRRSFLGDLLLFRIDGRNLIDPEGDRWVRD